MVQNDIWLLGAKTSSTVFLEKYNQCNSKTKVLMIEFSLPVISVDGNMSMCGEIMLHGS